MLKSMAPRTGYEVVMDSRGGDIFQVIVPDVRRQFGDGPGKVFANAERVANVEVEADRGGVQSFGDFQVLIGGFQKQVGLGLDQEQDPLFVGVVGERLQDLDEEVDRFLP